MCVTFCVVCRVMTRQKSADIFRLACLNFAKIFYDQGSSYWSFLRWARISHIPPFYAWISRRLLLKIQKDTAIFWPSTNRANWLIVNCVAGGKTFNKFWNVLKRVLSSSSAPSTASGFEVSFLYSKRFGSISRQIQLHEPNSALQIKNTRILIVRIRLRKFGKSPFLEQEPDESWTLTKDDGLTEKLLYQRVRLNGSWKLERQKPELQTH